MEITRREGNGAVQKKAEEQELAKTDTNVPVLNVALLEPKQKHPTIFRQFDALQQGDAFQILNDHDPKPLYYQLIAERGNIFTWNYIQKGPQWWRSARMLMQEFAELRKPYWGGHF